MRMVANGTEQKSPLPYLTFNLPEGTFSRLSAAGIKLGYDYEGGY
jgi:hypothetical protein